MTALARWRATCSIAAIVLAIAGSAAWSGVEVVRPAAEPAGKAQVEAGRKIYNFRCYFCHGYSGDAKTVAAGALNPKPRNFQTTTVEELPRKKIIDAITRGVAGTAMSSFAAVLPPVEIEAVAAFVESEFLIKRAKNTRYHTAENGWPNHDRYRRAFPFVRGDIPLSRSVTSLTNAQRGGRSLFMTHCITCHDPRASHDGDATWSKVKP